MQITLSADLHLTNRNEHLERYRAFQSMLESMRQDNRKVLCLAGDVFDASLNNYSDFDQICMQYPDISIYIIPGNHDPNLHKRQITARNVIVFSQPEIAQIEEDGPQFLFLPYEKNTNMGTRIAEFKSSLRPDKWVLIAHGDYPDGIHEPNPYEDGVYMPFLRKDIEMFHPAKVFLGHIHARMSKDPVYYTGSPCGLDISETGWRSCLVYETRTGMVQTRRVETDVVFFNESLTMLPTPDESAYLRAKALNIIQRWSLGDGDERKVRLRLQIKGYCVDKNNAISVLKDCFQGFNFYKSEEIDATELNTSQDADRILLAELVQNQISQQNWQTGADEPGRDEILLAALQIIYGG